MERKCDQNQVIKNAGQRTTDREARREQADAEFFLHHRSDF